MPWNPASLQEINNIWQYHIPVYSAQKSTKSNDYKTSMACRNVCEMQRRRQIVRCSNEWVLGFWDANEMSWKNIKSMMWKDQCTYESNEQMETWMTWMNTESLKPWVNGWTNKQTNELKPNRKKWTELELYKWDEMKWNGNKGHEMKWTSQWRKGWWNERMLLVPGTWKIPSTRWYCEKKMLQFKSHLTVCVMIPVSPCVPEDIITFNAAMRAMLRHWPKALQLLRLMRHSELRPTLVTYGDLSCCSHMTVLWQFMIPQNTQ